MLQARMQSKMVKFESDIQIRQLIYFRNNAARAEIGAGV